jgi:hypothetical protein
METQVSSGDLDNSNQPEASDADWSYVIANFQTLPADVQSLIKKTLPTLVDAAKKLSTHNGSASKNIQNHHLGLVSPGVSYGVTGSDHWGTTGGNFQEAILGNEFRWSHLTHSHNIGEDLTQDQQATYVASFKKIHGQSVEQTTSHQFEEIGGNFSSAINADHSQKIGGSRTVAIIENDSVQAKARVEVYGTQDTMDMGVAIVHDQSVYGTQNQTIGGNHFKSISGIAYYTFGSIGPQPSPLPKPTRPNAPKPSGLPNSKMGLMSLRAKAPNINQDLGVNSLVVSVYAADTSLDSKTNAMTPSSSSDDSSVSSNGDSDD